MVAIEHIDDTQSLATTDSEVSEDGDDLDYEFGDEDLTSHEGKVLVCVVVGCLFIALITCMGMVGLQPKKKKHVQLE